MNQRKRLHLLSFLSKEEKLDLPSKIAQNYDVSLLGRVLLKSVVSTQTGVPIRKISIKKTKTGKPLVQNIPFANYNVSVSHSKKYIAIATCINGKVGIDIESYREFDINSVTSFFTNDELTYIFAGKEVQKQLQNFYQIWTLKESYLKAIGKGLQSNLPEIKIQENRGSISFTEKQSLKRTYYFSTLREKDFVLSICTNLVISNNFLEENNIELQNEGGIFQ